MSPTPPNLLTDCGLWDAWTDHVELNMRIEDAMCCHNQIQDDCYLCATNRFAACTACGLTFSAQTVYADVQGRLWHEKCHAERDRITLTLYPDMMTPAHITLGNGVDFKIERTKVPGGFHLHVKNLRNA